MSSPPELHGVRESSASSSIRSAGEESALLDRGERQAPPRADNDALEPLRFSAPSDSTLPPPRFISKQVRTGTGDEKPTVTVPSGRSASQSRVMPSVRGAEYAKVGDSGVSKMYKFLLYETASRFYLVGSDVMDQSFRILKIDRTAASGHLSIAEDDVVYTREKMNETLKTVDDGNKSSGGLKLKSSTWGLLGFIRFTGDYYMLLITKRSQVAVLGGHYIYQIDGTELVSLAPTSLTRSKQDHHPEEARFVSILKNLDLSRSFYFSYSYDITHTLQFNICRERSTLLQDHPLSSSESFNDMFIWNHHLLKPAARVLKNTYDWCLPIIHGFADQASKVPLRLNNCATDLSLSAIHLRANGIHYRCRKAIPVFRWC
jgi:hypothetical protein